MKLILVALSLLLMISVSCKKSHTLSQANSICFNRTSLELRIDNNTNTKFYYTVFGESLLPLIDWFPACNDNNSIPANSTVHKDFSTIPGYSEDDSLVVYWWTCTGTTATLMQNVKLGKDQSVCRE